MMWHGTMGFGWVFWIFWILIAVVIIWLMAYVLKTNHPVEGSRENRALEILKERFARGEIDEEEYDRKWKKLRE